MMNTRISKLVISVIICITIGFLGSVFTSPAIDNWYSDLNKPFFNPPNWLFSPVWTVLFIMMGVSLFFIIDSQESEKRSLAISIFSIQLFLNFLWTVLFFVFHLPIIAFVEGIILWLAILFSIISTCRVSKIAGYLLLPYIIWISFAVVLNLSIVMMN